MMKATNALALAAILPCVAIAGLDSFAIDWFTIDGGGGTSSTIGGEFSLSGTIGQPDTGAAIGGPFSVQGGFWSGIGVVQSPGAPPLAIVPLPSGDLRIAWELPADGWVLDQSPTLGQAPSPWTEVDPTTYQDDATHRFIVIPNTGSNFYQLRLP